MMKPWVLALIAIAATCVVVAIGCAVAVTRTKPQAKPPQVSVVPLQRSLRRLGAPDPVDLRDIFGDSNARICVVGNGPSVLREHKGTAIDAHDVVVRMNDFQIRGFGHHTGRKTTHWVTGLARQQDKRTHIPAFVTIVWSHVHTDEVRVRTRLREMVERPNMTQVYHVHTRAVMDTLSAQYNLSTEPTTGLATLLLVTSYFQRPVSIVGFDCARVENTSESMEHSSSMEHYFGKTTVNNVDHALDREREIIQDLVVKGKLAWL